MKDVPKVHTIRDLARIAGVSPGTVSRALTGAGLISSKTRERIQKLAQEHDFRPNIMARNLRTQKTGAVGVVVPLGHGKGQYISDPFFMTMMGLLADMLAERGYDLILSRVIPREVRWLEKYTDSRRVDGIIVIGQSDQAKALDHVAEHYRPLVVWGGHSEGQVHCSVGSDNVAGGALAATHLVERGCKRIAFFGDPTSVENSQRLEGCRTALASAGLDDALSLFSPHPDADDRGMAKFLRSTKPGPDGIFAASDMIAMRALRVIAELGLAVPGEIKVVGYDGLAIGEHMVPRLTTVRQDLAAGARNLVDLLLRRIAGEETTSVVMPPELVVRRST